MFERVLRPCAGIVASACALGLAANALRERDRIELGRVYFAAPDAVPPPVDGSAVGSFGPRLPRIAPPPERESALAIRARTEFRVLGAAEAAALFRASQRLRGGVAHGDVVFVDARDDAHFRAGHVPGALQLDYYNLRADLAPVLPWLRFAPWIVVYCESDECEDGFLLCRALRDEYGVPARRILLFVGGMRAWRRGGLPLEEGGGG